MPFLRYMSFRNKNGNGKKTMKKRVTSNTRKIAKLESRFEKKYVYASRGYAAAVIGADLDDINGLFKGTDSQERIGDIVKTVGINLRVWCSSNGGNVTRSRFLLILTMKNNFEGGTPGVGEIFAHNATLLDTIQSVYNANSVGDDKLFKIIWDSGALEQNTTGSNSTRFYNVKKKLGFKVHYDGNTGGPIDILDNRLYLYHINTATTNNWGFSARMSYYDS